MLARHEGQVVLVAGAIPGETVEARVTRVARGTVYADTVRGGDRVAGPAAWRGRALRRRRLRPHRLPAAGGAEGRDHRGRLAAHRPPAGAGAGTRGGVARTWLPLPRPAARPRRPARLLPRRHAPAVRSGRHRATGGGDRGVDSPGRGDAANERRSQPRRGGRGGERRGHRACRPPVPPWQRGAGRAGSAGGGSDRAVRGSVGGRRR